MSASFDISGEFREKCQTYGNVSKKREDYLDWPDYFMAIAFLSAQRSKDPRTQVGACIVNEENKIVGIGYNGMPIGCHDDLMPWGREHEDILQTKQLYVCHAELNAVLNKNSADVKNCTIYVALFPCNECAKVVIQSGIKEVVFYSDKYHDKPPFIASRKMMDVAGVKYRQHIPKKKQILIDFTVIENMTQEVKDVLNDINSKRKWYLTWDQYFMAVALVSAERSKDPVTQVGACIVNKDNRIVGVGYNGMPNGCSDDDMPWGKGSDNILNTKKLYVCHAEMNSIVNKISADIRGCSIYVTLYPCNNCAKIIIQSGIKEVIFYYDKNRHKDEAKASQYMFDKAGISVRKFKPSSVPLLVGQVNSKL